MIDMAGNRLFRPLLRTRRSAGKITFRSQRCMSGGGCQRTERADS